MGREAAGEWTPLGRGVRGRNREVAGGGEDGEAS